MLPRLRSRKRRTIVAGETQLRRSPARYRPSGERKTKTEWNQDGIVIFSLPILYRRRQ